MSHFDTGAGDQRDDVYVAPEDQFNGDEYLPEERRSWPAVVGGIGLGWGVLAILCTGGQTISSAMTASGNTPQALVPGPVEYAMTAAGLALSILLIIAAIMLLSGKPAARGLHLLWASLAVLLIVGSTAYGFLRLDDIVAAMQQQAEQQAQQQGQPAPEMSWMKPVMIGSFIVTGLIRLIWPVFCLIWFGLVKTDTSKYTRGGPEVL